MGSWRWLVTGGLALLVAAPLLGCSGPDSGRGGTPGAPTTPGDAPISATPGGPTVTAESPLHGARMDASGRRRLDASPLAVELVSLEEAGWNGCLGIDNGGPCSELFVVGYIAVFRANGREAPYHIGMGRFIGPVDNVKSKILDPSPVPPEMRTDFNAVLALYVRHELALRLESGLGAVTVEAIVPVTFPDSCLGWARPGLTCAQMSVPGAVVLLAGPDGKTYRYHVSQQGVVATDFVAGSATREPSAAVVEVERRMREDLARRTGVPVAQVSLLAYREVTWPNGCLGVNSPGAICTQALVDGFLALLTDSSGYEYRYHGTGSRFIAASFEKGAITGPLPPPR